MTPPVGNPHRKTCVSSGYIIATGQVVAARAVLAHIELITDGTNDATAVVYDGTSAVAGKELFHSFAAGEDVVVGGVNLNILASDGLYITLTGVGAKAIVHYTVLPERI